MMDIKMDGKLIDSVWWPEESSGERGFLQAADDERLVFRATHHGDRDEFWIVEEHFINQEWVEVSRHNPRYIESIVWLIKNV